MEPGCSRFNPLVFRTRRALMTPYLCFCATVFAFFLGADTCCDCNRFHDGVKEGLIVSCYLGVIALVVGILFCEGSITGAFYFAGSAACGHFAGAVYTSAVA